MNTKELLLNAATEIQKCKEELLCVESKAAHIRGKIEGMEEFKAWLALEKNHTEESRELVKEPEADHIVDADKMVKIGFYKTLQPGYVRGLFVHAIVDNYAYFTVINGSYRDGDNKGISIYFRCDLNGANICFKKNIYDLWDISIVSDIDLSTYSETLEGLK